MAQLPQQLINGIWQGAALALFAMGYTLVFGVLDVVNLAHGANYMWGAFFAFLCVTQLGWPLWVSIPLAMLGAGLLAVLAAAMMTTSSIGLTSRIAWFGYGECLYGLARLGVMHLDPLNAARIF